MRTPSANRLSAQHWSMVLLVAFAFALAIFTVLMVDHLRFTAQKRNGLIQLSEAYITEFNAARGDETIVPSELRRRALERFSHAMTDEGLPTGVDHSMRMSGPPSLALSRAEQDPRLATMIEEQFGTGSVTPVIEHRIENGRLIARTISPAIATAPSCVSCHNAALGVSVYETGDVMGLMIVESDATGAALSYLGVFSIVFLTVAAIGFRIATVAQTRVAEVVAGLRRAVTAERERTQAVEYARFLASHDSLTGLANRAMFLDRLQADIDDGVPVFLALIDADDFKSVNDTYGHDAGDAFLSETGKRLLILAGENDGLASRLGGDEFAILVRIAEAGEGFPDLLHDTLTQEIEHAGITLEPGYSIGMASSADLVDRQHSTLLKYADSALYAAKEDGKNRVRVFDAGISAAMIRRTELFDGIGGALEAGRIEAHFQPRVDLASGEVVGFEALARWHMQNETLMPGEFVSLAEETRLIGDLDMAVFEDAARFITWLNASEGRAFGLSVNLSVATVRDDGLAERIMDVLHSTALDPRLLTLDVTESVLVMNWQEVARGITPLRDLGIGLALDDFGAGYSALGHLRNYPFDEIKIDGFFTSALGEDDAADTLFRSLAQMGAGLGKRLVAEAIETEEQARRAAAHGVSLGQGHWFAEPMPQSEVPAYLADRALPKAQGA